MKHDIQIIHLESGAILFKDTLNQNNWAQLPNGHKVTQDIFFPHATKAFRKEIYDLIEYVAKMPTEIEQYIKEQVK